MTSEEWEEIVEWINQRFPTNGWRAQQAVAYFYDLREFDPSDVWSALFKMYNRGLEYPPNGSTLKHETLTERREAAIRERMAMPRLPSDTSGVMPFGEYVLKTYGEPLTWAQVIERTHREQTCRIVTCDIHKEERR